MITRFNVNLNRKDKFGEDTLTRKWMLDRFQRFEKYCIPSVSNQSVKNFTWLVLFDKSTSDEFIDRIDKYKTELPFFCPVFLDSPLFTVTLKKSVYDNLLPGDEFVITSRLDNDDALHKNYMVEVQKLFDYQWDSFILFECGYQWIEDKAIFLKFDQLFGNHFTSRIESRDKGIDTVIGVDNTKIYDLPDVIISNVHNRSNRLWMEVVHNTNICNHPRDLMPEINHSVLKWFNVDCKINNKNQARELRRHLRRVTGLTKIDSTLRKFGRKIIPKK